MRRSENLTYLLLFALSALYLLTFYRYGLNLWDEGVLLNGALRTYRGEMVLRDFHGYPPGRYIMGAALFGLFGVKASLLRMALLFMTSVAVSMLFKTAKRIMPSTFAIVPALFFLIAPAVYYNRFFPIFTILNITFLVDYIYERDKKRLYFLLAGLALTLVFKIEIAVISFFIAAITIVFADGKRSVKPFLISGVAGLVAILLFAGVGFVVELYHIIFRIHSAWGIPFPAFFSWNPLSKSFFEAFLFYLPIVIYCSSLVIIFRGREVGKKQLLIIIITAFGFTTYGLVIWRAGFDNLIRVLPAAFLLGSYLLHLIYNNLRSKKICKTKSTFVVMIIPLYIAANLILNYGFYIGSIGELRREHSRLAIPSIELYTNRIEAGWVNEIVAYIENNSVDHDTLFAPPLHSIFNFMTGRTNPTSYEWILPGMFRNMGEEDYVIAQLENYATPIIVCSDIAIDNRDDRMFSHYAPKIYDYIKAEYRLVKIVGFFEIWQRE